ncbi:hypothetical protein VPH35_015013 [Triticum aestivum]
MEEQIAALAKAVNDSRIANDARLDAIQQSLELWRPAVTNLQQLDALRTQVGRIALHPALASPPATQEGAVVRPAGVNSVDIPRHHGPSGHGEVIDSGVSAHGVVTTLTPPPGKGALLDLTPPSPPLVSPHQDFEHGSHHNSHSNWALPKLDFPQFEGKNPQFWKTRCEKYFAVYGVQPDLWVRVATLHFSGTAAC